LPVLTASRTWMRLLADPVAFEKGSPSKNSS
jgi:hypothetical protein